MKTRQGIILGIGAILFVVFLGDISWAGGKIRERHSRQRSRIAHGVRTGEITKKERIHLKREQRKIRRVAKRAWADGYLDYGERQRLRKIQNRASRHIYRAKHNPRWAHGKWTRQHSPKRHRTYDDDSCRKPSQRKPYRRHLNRYVPNRLGRFVAEPEWCFAWSSRFD